MITKVGHGTEMEQAIGAYRLEKGGHTALAIVFDEHGYPISIVSDGFPDRVRRDVADYLNEILRRIHKGEGVN